jgi:predicted permease
MRAWMDRLRAVLARRRAERELAEELEFHLAMQIRKHVGGGMDAGQAAALARREFGNVELVKEDARDVRGARLFDEVMQDVRYGLRSFARAPAFALSLVVTIGLGVGISSSAFTVFNAYVLRPFDVRDPSSLYSVNWMDRSGRYHDFNRADFDAVRRTNASISDVLAFRTFALRLGSSAATADAVSQNYFEMLGVRPALGRMFRPDDGALPVVVISYAAWLTRFAADSSLVGRRVLLRGSPFQVVGIAQPGFSGLFKRPRDLWIPLGSEASLDSSLATRASSGDLQFIARLAAGTSEAQGRAVVAAVLQSATAARPDSGRVARVFFESRESPIPGSMKSYVMFAPLVLSFGLILLLACANVANVLLARGIERRRELGIRLALGAARARLIRQLVTESVVLTLPAAMLGFGLAWTIVTVGIRAVFATLPADLAPFVRFVPLAPDWRVVAFAVVATIASAFLCGLAPSLRATRLSVVQATRGSFDDTGAPRGRRGALIVGQIAASSLLLIMAALLLREAARLGRVETGLRTHDVVSIEPEAKGRVAVLSAVRASPRVDNVAAATALPLDMKWPSAVVAGDSALVDVIYNRVTASYFDVLGIGVIGGRALTRGDEDGPTPVVVISESAARRLWPRANPLGRVLNLRLRGDTSEPLVRYQNARVVGVVPDVVVGSVEAGKEASVLYFPSPIESIGCCLLVRVRGNADGSKRALDAALDRAVPGGVDRIDRLETFVAGAIYPFRVAYWVALILGVIALTLTVVGVYGVVAYLVGQRTREIGIRIALGATTSDVLALVMRQSVRQAVIGTAIGLSLALGLARVIAANVPGVPVFDFVAVLAASACVLVACSIASFLPSRRASSVDPTTALRHD